MLQWNSKQYLDYGTIWDWQDDDGVFSWGIAWFLKGGPLAKRKRRHHWVVQRILVENTAVDCDGNMKDHLNGWRQGVTTYLEAWPVKFAGFLPMVTSGDVWEQEGTDESVGNLRMRGDAIWVGKNTTPRNWERGGARQAGTLRSTAAEADTALVDPIWSGITGSDRRSKILKRTRHYTWDTCVK